MKRKKIRVSDESGSVVIEATYIIFLVTLLVGLLIGFMLVIFQRYQLQAIADNSAARIGRIYPYVQVDPKTQRVSQADINESAKIFTTSGLYRYTFFGDIESPNVQRAEEYTDYALDGVSLISPVSKEITATVVDDTLAVRHIEVTVTATYKVPLGGFFRFFGLSDTVTYSAMSRAQCIDLVDYVNTISYVQFAEKEFKSLPIIGNIIGIIENIIGLFS